MSKVYLPDLANFSWQPPVLDSRDSPTSSPTKGERHIVIATASGSWSGKEGYIAWYNGSSWEFVESAEGTMVYDNDTNDFLVKGNSTTWASFTPGSGQPLDDVLTSISGLTMSADKILVGVDASNMKLDTPTELMALLSSSCGATFGFNNQDVSDVAKLSSSNIVTDAITVGSGGDSITQIEYDSDLNEAVITFA